MGDAQAVLRHRPHGRWRCLLCPYNFPGHLPNKPYRAGAAGRQLRAVQTVELAPAVARNTTDAAVAAAGLPAGVISLLQGGRATPGRHWPAMTAWMGCFADSSSAGQQLHQLYASRPDKILALEMGGNNPLIVDHVADVDAALHHIVQSAFVSRQPALHLRASSAGGARRRGDALLVINRGMRGAARGPLGR